MKRNILSLAVGAALVAGVSSASSSVSEIKPEQNFANKVIELGTAARDARFTNAIEFGNNRIGVIVQLEDVPSALFPAVNPSVSQSSTGKSFGDVDFKSSAALEYKAHLRQQQNQVINSAKTLDSELQTFQRYDTVMNGFAAAVDRDKVASLMKLPGVKAVYPDTLMHASMDRSLDLINAPEVWEALGGYPEAGKGVKVAIIDSGLRNENPLFSGEGFEAPDDVPTDDYCATVDASFCNGKIIAARYADPSNLDIVDGEYISPFAFNGHGTHVAGTAVGNWGVEATRGEVTETISGVAPAAYLMVYKGLFATNANPASSSGSNAMLIEMLEAAVEDGADVINNSWGGGAAPVSQVYEDIFVAAKAAGSVMVFAAGNDGPGPGTIGSPGTSGEVLTVAMSTTSRTTANFFSLAGSDVQNTLALTAGPVAVNEDITLPIVYAGSVDEGNFEGCTAWENTEAFTGAMALISRGSCTFNDKIVFAQDAGASGVIIFNNQPDASPIGMAVDDSLLTVPAAMIGTNAGLATVEALAADASAMATLTAGTPFEDSIAGGSSRGPNADPNVLNPNLAAPGVSILSGESPDAPGHEGENFSFKTGTSMASPHVAGAAALVKQINPDWTVEQIMSAVTHTAVRDTLVKEDFETPADAFDRGAGRLDVERASKAQLTYSELGLANASCFNNCGWTFTVTNTTDSDITVDMEDYMTMGSGVEIETTPGDATIPAGETVEVSVMIDTSQAVSTEQWVFGGIEWDDGNVETPEYYMPIAVYPQSSEAIGVFNSGTTDTFPLPEEAVVLTSNINNTSFVDTIEFSGTVADKFVIDAANSSAVVNGENQDLTIEGNTVTWSGTLGTTEFAATPNSKPQDELELFGFPGYTSMAAIGASPEACPGGCDEFTLEVGIFPFNFLGQEYSSITVGDNGILAFGSQDFTGSYFAQQMPNATTPNNVIAPFWADFDLSNGTAEDTGSGSIYTAYLNLPNFGCEFCGEYFVIEWSNVQPWNIPGQSYSMQVWLERGTNNIYYAYGAVGDNPTALAATSGAAVGAEGPDGVVGFTQGGVDFSGNVLGTLPMAGDTWQIQAQLGDSAAINIAGALEARDALISDSGTMMEDGEPLMVDVLSNDTDRSVTSNFQITSGETTLNSLKTLVYGFPAVDGTSLAIAEQPSNGMAAVAGDGYVTYTPNADFNGDDSFTYSVETADGSMDTATVNVNVTPVNDAPVINAINVPSVTVEGGFVSVSVDASDIDGDDLTITINGNEGASASLLAPQVSRDGGSLDITVTVTDGIETVTQTTAVTVNDAPKGDGGSMAWYSLLLLPLTWLRRRKQA